MADSDLTRMSNEEYRELITAFAHRLAKRDDPDRDYILAVGGVSVEDEIAVRYGIAYMPWCGCEHCSLIRQTLLEDGVDLSAFPSYQEPDDDDDDEDYPYSDEYENDYDDYDEEEDEEE